MSLSEETALEVFGAFRFAWDRALADERRGEPDFQKAWEDYKRADWGQYSYPYPHASN